MPKYRVETDQGTFEVELDEPPASPEELQGLVEEQLGGAAPEQPAAEEPPKKGWFASRAEPATKAVAKGVHTAGEFLQSVAPLPWETRTPEQRRQAAEVGAEFVVPQSAAEAGAQVLTGGTGKIATGLLKGATLAARAGRGAARVAGAAGGGALGAASEGEDPGAAAARMGGAAAFGEGVISPAVGFLRRSLPNRFLGLPVGKKYMQQQYQRQVGEAIQNIVPEFGKLATGDDFVRVAKVARDVALKGPAGRTTIGKVLDDAEKDIVGRIGANTQLALPALGMQAGIPVTKPFPQAVAHLRRLYRVGYTAERAGRGDLALKARERAGELFHDITAGLHRHGGKQAAEAFVTSQQKYAKGLELATEVERALKLSAEGVHLDEPALQQAVFNRLRKATETFKHDEAGLKAWLDTVYRGAPFGKSEIGAGSGSMVEPIRRLLRQGGGAGTTAITPIRMALPNIGSRYLGAPRPGDRARMWLDIGLEKAAEHGLGGN